MRRYVLQFMCGSSSCFGWSSLFVSHGAHSNRLHYLFTGCLHGSWHVCPKGKAGACYSRRFWDGCRKSDAERLWQKHVDQETVEIGCVQLFFWETVVLLVIQWHCIPYFSFLQAIFLLWHFFILLWDYIFCVNLKLLWKQVLLIFSFWLAQGVQ